MSAADWGILIPAIVALIVALTAFLQSQTAKNRVSNVQAKQDVALTAHTDLQSQISDLRGRVDKLNGAP